MKVNDYKEMMDYLTRPEPPKMQVASVEERVLKREPFYQQQQESVQEDKASPQEDAIPLYQDMQPGIAIEETMPNYVPPNMSPVMPSAPGIPNPQDRILELATGGRVELKDGTKEPPKFIPMDLESVAFRLFRNNLDNLTYNEKQIVYDYIEENRNKKANGGRIGYADGTPMAGLAITSLRPVNTNMTQEQIDQYINSPIPLGLMIPQNEMLPNETYLDFVRRKRKEEIYQVSPTANIISGTGGFPGGPLSSTTTASDSTPLTVQERYNKYLSTAGSKTNNDLYKLYRESIDKKATGGRVNLANGTEEIYNPEIPSLGETDPIGILEQQLINEKDPIRALALDYQLEKLKKESKAKEIEKEEFKKSQKEKGIKYKEDFPSETEYFLETAKQLMTNPKYFLGKGAKGVVEGTEFLVGQPLQTLLSQEGKNFEFYQPVAGEKLGINKFIEKNVPKNPTTGALLAGDVAEITGSIADPFLAYGVGKSILKKVEKKNKK